MKDDLKTHYLLRDPGLLLPLAALVINLVFVLFLLVQTHRSHNNLRLIFPAQRPGVSASAVAAPSGPVLVVGPGEQVKLNGETLSSEQDLQFRLNGASRPARSAVTLRVAPDVAARTLIRVMQSCAAAGFPDVAVEPAPGEPQAGAK